VAGASCIGAAFPGMWAAICQHRARTPGVLVLGWELDPYE
jgi:hypothetical protein